MAVQRHDRKRKARLLGLRNHAIWECANEGGKDGKCDKYKGKSFLTILVPRHLRCLLWDASEGWVLDTATSISKASDWSVIRPALKLFLHGLRQHGPIDV